VPSVLPDRRPFAGWSGTTCLVTGGLGFVGCNLARALVDGGASVRVVDALVPSHGGRADHLDGVAVDKVLVASIADPDVAELLDGCDVVFNVAGQVSHTASMVDPQQDLLLNATSHALLLDTIRRVRPTARVLYTSTRQVYGRSTMATVDETHVARPVDVNGVAKLAGEQLHLVYAHAYGLAACALRLTNVYGPRQRLTSDELGFLPVFVRRALLDEPIEIFGEGTQRRDCLHVADVVDAIAAATSDRAVGQVFNVGHPATHTVAEIAAAVVLAAGGTAGVRLVAWPDERARIDIGSFHTGSARIESELGWRAAIALDDGLADTIEFYREHPWYLSST
jgi:nucleoside-diphosphate-sugar epimerase